MSGVKKFKTYLTKNRLGAIVIGAFLTVGIGYLIFSKVATMLVSVTVPTSMSVPLTSSAVISSKSATLVSANPAALQTTGLGNSIGGYRSFVKFNVTTPNTTDVINSVQLKVYTQTANGAGFYLKGVADSTWDPAKITYNSHPIIGSILADSGATTVGAWKTINLTTIVKATGLVSFCLYPKDGGIIQYSNAGATAPQLVVTYTPASPAVDTAAPTNVAITAPTAGATLSGAFNFVSSASDNVGVSKVEFYNDSTLIGTAGSSTTSSYLVSGFDTTKLADGTHNIYSIAYDAAGNKTQSATVSYTVKNAVPVATLSNIRATFYYPWFPETWGSLTAPDTHYNPTAGFYSSDTASVITKHIQEMTYAGLDASIASWWGQGQHKENTRIPALLNNSANSSNGKNLKWALYYEKESTGDPTVTQINADLTYIKSNYATNSNYLQINGKPVVFVFTDGNDSCAMAQRWHDANTVGFYVVLKVFSGYTACATQPDGWHQYGPASASDSQGKYSYTISPGFWLYKEATPRLARLSAATWTASVNAMVASNAQFQLVTTLNEWGEGTAVEPANEWASASGYGTYIDVLHQVLNANAPTVLDTTPPTAPTAFKAALASTSSKTVNLSWAASTDNGTGVKQYDITRTDANNNKASFIAAANATGYSDSSTIYNMDYTYSITASDNATPSNVSTATTATVTTPTQPVTAPAAPTGLTATPVSSTQINLSWTASVDTTGLIGGYRVFRNGTQVATIPGTGTAFADTGLAAATSYSYTVLAYDSVTTTLVSAQSSAVSSTTQAAPVAPSDTTAPSAPTNVTAALASTTTNTITVNWGASTDNAGGSGLKQYIVSRTDSASTVVQFTVPAGTTTYSDSSTNYSTSTSKSSYVYAVSAQDNAVPANTSAAVSAASVTTPVKPDTAAPNVPGAPTVTANSGIQTTISWSAVTDNPTDGTASGVKGYKVFRDGVQIADVATLSVNDSFTFVAGQAYKYTVLAYDVAGNASAQSAATSSTPAQIIAAAANCGNVSTGNKIDTVIVIAMENRTWGGATSVSMSSVGMGFDPATMPYTHNLAASCTYFQKDTEVNTADNSAQQYVGAWTGYNSTTTHVSADCLPSATCSYTGNNIFRVFRNANIPHREYVEGVNTSCTSTGSSSPAPAKHIPGLYMWDTTDKANCANEVLPISQFNFATPPTGFTFITPTLCNDGHDCVDPTVDSWLSDPTRLPALLNSAAYKNGHVLLQIWYDEDHPKPNLTACYSCNQSINTVTDPTYAGETQLWMNLLGAPITNLGGISTGLDIRPLVGTP